MWLQTRSEHGVGSNGGLSPSRPFHPLGPSCVTAVPGLAVAPTLLLSHFHSLLFDVLLGLGLYLCPAVHGPSSLLLATQPHKPPPLLAPLSSLT